MKIKQFSLVPALALGSLMVCGNFAVAQDKADAPGGAPPPGGRGRGMPSAEMRMERMSKELELTAEQKPKVEAALKETDKKMQELRADTSIAREDRQPKMRAIREEETKKLKEILTADQFKKYEEMAPRGRGPGGPGGRPDGAAPAPKKPDAKAE
jgi:protein CpxP